MEAEVTAGDFLVSQLLRPQAYPHPVDLVQLRETHISWVFLTGQFAYKVKKPVNFGFVDFSTAAARHYYCREELARNRSFAAGLYLDVVPINQADHRLVVAGPGETVDYAVKMVQFDEALLASRLLTAGQLGPEEISDLAVRIAGLHRAAEAAGPEQPWGQPVMVLAPALENVTALRSRVEPSQWQRLEQVAAWTEQTATALHAAFLRRQAQGRIRRCHGDLHLGNLVRWQGQLTPFDCIEFNPDFYWIDVANEIAFLIMDLDDHGHSALGKRFLDIYLQDSGDYASLAVLTFYLVYRAMVRAKVCQLRCDQPGLTEQMRRELVCQRDEYLEMALRYLQPRHRSLTITHGLSGSGKTFGSQRLVEQSGAIRIRADVERKRLFHLTASDRPSAQLAEQMYATEATRQTYARLESLAEEILRAGFAVVVDATFLQRWQRQRFQQLAQQLAVPFQIAEFSADVECLRRRLRERQQQARDASDADERVLEMQLAINQPLQEDERSYLVCLVDP